MKRFLAMLLAGIMILSLSACGEKGEQFDWNDMELGVLLPAPKSNIGEISINIEDHLSIRVHGTSKDDYKEYLAECQSAGFTVESDKSENRYNAFNETGYKLSLLYMESSKELHISLDAPMKMQTLQWPTSEIAKLLPVPKSTLGKIRSESSKHLYVYVGETPLDDYKAYVNACSEKGFHVDSDKGDTYYNADNADGYHISLKYQGNHVMSIEISMPDNEVTDGASSEDTSTGKEPGLDVEVKVVCTENLIFSTYDVGFYIDDSLVGTIKHGATETYTEPLEKGSHTLRFENSDDDTVTGEVTVDIAKAGKLEFKIWCHSGEIKVDTVANSVKEEETTDKTDSEPTETSKPNDTSSEDTSSEPNTAASQTPSGNQTTTSKPTENTTPPGNSRIVYWTPNGKSYHSRKNCPTLSRSKTILEGTIAQSGKSDACDKCF